MVEFSNLAVVNAKKFVNTGDHSLFTAFALGALLLNEVVHNVALGLETKLALHIESAISQSFLLAMRSDKQATVDANTIKPLVESVFAKQNIRIGF